MSCSIRMVLVPLLLMVSMLWQVGVLRSEEVVSVTDAFPVPFGVYESATPIKRVNTVGVFTGLRLINPEGTPPPTGGDSATVEQAFSIPLDIEIGGVDYSVNSLVEVTYEITDTTLPGSTSRTWDTEILSMSLTGVAPGGPSFEIRESSTVASLGQRVVTDVGDGTYLVDSLFELWSEISIDGEPFTPADEPVTLRLVRVVPEPSTMLLLTGLAGMFICFRKRWCYR